MDLIFGWTDGKNYKIATTISMINYSKSQNAQLTLLPFPFLFIPAFGSNTSLLPLNFPATEIVVILIKLVKS